MKVIVAFLIVTGLFSYVYGQTIEPQKKNSVITNDSLRYICDSIFGFELVLHWDTIKDSEGFYEVGLLGKCNEGDVIGFKIGEWRQYYASGKIRRQGVFKFDLLRDCGPAGYTWGQYTYKYGRWIYYFENGNIQSEIYFDVKAFPQRTLECGDSVLVRTATISNSSRFFDINNNAIIPDSTTRNFYEKDATELVFDKKRGQ